MPKFTTPAEVFGFLTSDIEGYEEDYYQIGKAVVELGYTDKVDLWKRGFNIGIRVPEEKEYAEIGKDFKNNQRTHNGKAFGEQCHLVAQQVFNKPDIEVIERVALAIEAGELVDEFGNRLGFNMGVWHQSRVNSPEVKDMSGHNCGSVACLGGWVEAVTRTRTLSVNEGKAIGLTPFQAARLFYPRRMWSRTQEESVAMLRSMKDGGLPKWSDLNGKD